MDTETLLETAALVQGRLRDQRDEICAGYVEWAIFSRDSLNEFNIENIINIIESKTGISFEPIQVNSALEKLVDSGKIEHINEETYVQSIENEITSVDSLIEECWEDFQDILNQNPRDIDVYAIDTNIKPAFQEFFNVYVNKLEEETEILEEFQQDVMYSDDIESLISKVARENRVDKSDVFEECMTLFLQNPSSSLKEFVGVVYLAIVNSDLLQRQKDIKLPEVPQEEKKIFFDSNVIQELLCETNDRYPLIKNIIKRSNELDFELYYFPETINDLQRSIDGAIREMRGVKGGNYTGQNFTNQFVQDWHKKFMESGEEWTEYRTFIQKWELEVKAKWQILPYEQEVGVPEEEYEYARNIIDRVDSERGSGMKDPEILNHDADILSKTSFLRDSVSSRHSVGPVLLSLDNSVTQASDIACEKGDWKKGISVPPRVWFNYLLTFTSAEIESVELGEIILNVSANISSKPTIEEYSKVIEEKAGLGSGSSEYIAEYLRYTEFEEQLERSLRSDDGNADKYAFKALSDEEAMDEFTKHKESKKQIRNMGQTIRDLEEKLAKAEGNSDNYIIGGNAEAHGGESKSKATAKATATSEASAKIEQEISDFLDIYHEEVPSEISSEVPPPPEDTSDLDSVLRWLEIVTTAIQVAEPSTAALTAVTKFGAKLIEDISSFRE